MAQYQLNIFQEFLHNLPQKTALQIRYVEFDFIENLISDTLFQRPPSFSSIPPVNDPASTDLPGTAPDDLPQDVPEPNYSAGSSLPNAPPSGPTPAVSGSIELQTPDDAPHSGPAAEHPAGPYAHQDVSRNIQSRDVNVPIYFPGPSGPALAISTRWLSANRFTIRRPPNASTSSIPPANGPPPTDGSQPIPSPTSPASADGTRPTGLVQGDPAPSYGEPSSPPASSVPSFNGPTPPAPSGSELTPPQGPPPHKCPQSAPVDGSVPMDLPYIVQPASLTSSSSSLLPVIDPAPTGLSQPIPARDSPAPTDSAVPTSVPVPNVSRNSF